MSTQIFIARAIAVVAHKGQRYGKEPYFRHPQDVARRVYDETQGEEIQVAAAWLHDVLEDTKVTKADLAEAGVDYRVIELVQILTREDGESYREYIIRVANNRRAATIKLADLAANLSHNPRESLRIRYMAAVHFLRGNGTAISII